MINEKMGEKNIFRSLSLSLSSFPFPGRVGGVRQIARMRVATQRGMAMHSRAHVMMVFGLSTSRSS
jgi:hypothetical protein